MAQNGYAIGIDLGTSNTVAVVRWPDGRTRPLLFDGQPILPSGVYLDEANQLHVGRDAQRMAQLDPSRYEPNPKRRIDEPTTLLGDREGPTVGLLAASLQAIATKAKETCGLLPPAVLTHPAAWGASRRGILTDAATRAGWPLVRLLAEPIGAARYFADTLHQPIPDGGCLAVFDFGGGTLDVAVVRNDRGRFEVIGSGGAEDLGGLDIDAAIVEHLGRLLAVRHPDVWQRLSAPVTPVDRRHRRLFWEDVRGAKEMLSRTTVAPVPIPGVDEALHLTREELEHLARPLLTRAVAQTAEVIEACRLRPGQLTGIFLVGGTSRIPLVAQLLHARLGVAPTALEQPELPVAEGAIAELSAADSPAMFHAAAPAAPAGPPGPTEPIGPPRPPSRAWYRRPWVYAVAGIAALAVLAGSLFYYFGRTELPFSPLTSVATVPLEGRQPLGTDIEDGRAYLASYDEGGTLHLTMVDLASGRKQEVRAATEEDWGWYGANPFGLVAYGESDDQRTVHVYDLVTLEEIYTDEIGDDTWHFPVGDLMVRVEPDRDALVWIDVAQGLQVASVDYGSRFFRVGNWSDEETAASLWGHRFQQPYPDNRLVAISDEGTLRVLDAHNGKDLKSTTVEQLGSGDRAMAYQGLFFVAGAVDEGDGYQVNAYDLDKLGEPRQIFRDDRPEVTPERIEPCGAELICLVNSSSELVVVNFKTGKEVWRTTIAKPSEVATILPVGNRIMVNHEQSDTVYSVFFDAAGVLVEKSEGWGAPVDAGSALLFDSDVASVSNASVDVATDVRSIRLVGVGAQSGDKTQIGAFDADPSTCSWDSRYIACAGSAAFLLHRFRQV